MLTGVIPRKHEIEWNKDLPLSKPVYPKFPTLFAVAHKAGYTTAMAAGKSKFKTLDTPDSLDWKWITESEKAEDADVARQAVAILRAHQPQVMFVHLPSVDNVGHKVGWGTPEQARAVEQADKCVGMILNALYELGLREQTVILLTADHGGAGKTHLPDDARARHIPWIANGPGIRKGVDLTIYPELVINTEDTFATACYLLGVIPSKEIDGKPIKEILEERGDLLQDVTPNSPHHVAAR
jgi:arylsulfatase A-like enzyme